MKTKIIPVNRNCLLSDRNCRAYAVARTYRGEQNANNRVESVFFFSLSSLRTFPIYFVYACVRLFVLPKQFFSSHRSAVTFPPNINFSASSPSPVRPIRLIAVSQGFYPLPAIRIITAPNHSVCATHAPDPFSCIF